MESGVHLDFFLSRAARLDSLSKNPQPPVLHHLSRPLVIVRLLQRGHGSSLNQQVCSMRRVFM